jgi:hypothetical protein
MARLTDTQLTWPESDLAAPTDAIYQHLGAKKGAER